MRSLPNFKLLYEDNDIIVCGKPSGIATQSRRPGVPDLEHLLLNHIAAQNRKENPSAARPPFLSVIHRLDQPVSGILVFAKSPEMAGNLNRQLTSKGFGKHYLALVTNAPASPSGTLTDYLVKDSKTNASRVCTADTPGAKLAKLNYRVLENQRFWNDPDGTLLKVILDTGRHHQIRVQLAHMGCPIKGDTKYHPKTSRQSGWQTIRLCAYRLSFLHPRTGKPMQFQLEAPIT